MSCTPSMPLPKIPQVHCYELFEHTEGCPTHYTLLLLITIVL